MDDAARDYIDAIAAEQRPLFDRMHGLILEVVPEADIALSYKMPTYRANGRGLHVATWKHGVSLYGWGEDRDGGFLAKHPGLDSGTGTLRIRPSDADSISDDDLRDLLRATFAP